MVLESKNLNLNLFRRETCLKKEKRLHRNNGTVHGSASQYIDDLLNWQHNTGSYSDV